MIFSSLIFLFYFLPVILLAYYIVPNRWHNIILFLFSFIFYAWGEPVYVILMMTTIVISYSSGIFIEKFKRYGKYKAAKTTLIISSFINLLLLAFFKYADFAIKVTNNIFDVSISMIHIALPIGISFYIFQTLSYIIDVYRGDADVQKNIIHFGLYVSMFPQLIAGPIVRYKTIETQLYMRKETAEHFSYGIQRFIIGLGKKVLLANNTGELWNIIQSMTYTETPILTAWIGLIAYTFQIYFDFSAYSDMAIGLGYLFGFQFLENFNYPYISKSITEFWHRWHISLSTWFKEYIYIPLGGNRVGFWRYVRNIMIVWLLTGIWHGASYNFVLWGIYYGILLLVEKLIFGKYLNKLPIVLQHIYCMFFVMMGWNLFVFDDISQGIEFMKSLFGIYGQKIINTETIYILYNNIVLIVLCIFGSTKLPYKIAKWIFTKLKNKIILQIIIQNTFYIVIFILSVAWIVDATFNPFLYFRF